MSVLLLHNTEELAAKLRDDEHMLADGAGHVLVDRAALTVDLMSVLLLGARPRANVPRTEHELGEGLRLRITHDARVMGPPGLRNLGPGLHAAPWGVWLVFRGKDISDCGHIDDCEIEDILERVKRVAGARPPAYLVRKVALPQPQKKRARFKFAFSRDDLRFAPLRPCPPCPLAQP